MNTPASASVSVPNAGPFWNLALLSMPSGQGQKVITALQRQVLYVRVKHSFGLEYLSGSHDVVCQFA